MSINKDNLRVQTKEEFKKNDLDYLEERYNRYLWAVQEWERIMGRTINLPPHIRTLYVDGSCAFYYGYYSASILTITATIELSLKAIIDLSQMSSRVQKSLLNVIIEAVKQEIISDELAKNLHFLRKYTRNILPHKQDMASHLTIGWEKDPESKTGHMLSDERLEKLVKLQRGSKSLFESREVFSKEAIQLMFQVFQSVLNSDRNWSNLI